MRANLESNQARNVRHISPKYGAIDQTLTGVLTLGPDASTLQALNANGVDKTVILPVRAAMGGQLFIFFNSGVAGNLLVVDSLGAAVQTLLPSNVAIVFSTPARWASFAANSSGAPGDATYLTATANATLSAERVTTDSTSVLWDASVGGQIALLRAALTGDVTASQNSNATTVAKIQGTTVTGTTGSGKLAFDTGATLASPTFVTPVLGTPASGTLTNCVGLPIGTGVANLGANVATFLTTPSSANLKAALTDETGSGAAVFGTSPTITTPLISGVSLFATSTTVALGSGVAWGFSKNAVATLPLAGLTNVTTQFAQADGVPQKVQLLSAGTASPNTIAFETSRGTMGSPTATQSADVLGSIFFYGYGATGYGVAAGAGITSEATENYSDTAQGSNLKFFTTPNTTVTPVEVARLNPSGALSLGGISSALGSGSLIATGSIVSSSATSSGLGYATGAGGTVTQATSKSTGVTLNARCGQITMNNAALAANTTVSFQVTNSAVTNTGMVVVAIRSGATASSYICSVGAITGGAFTIDVRNISGGSLSEAIVISFMVFSGVSN